MSWTNQQKLNERIQCADCFILAYDISRGETFTNLKIWLDKIQEFAKKNVQIYLVGNKLDL